MKTKDGPNVIVKYDAPTSSTINTTGLFTAFDIVGATNQSAHDKARPGLHVVHGSGPC